MNGPSGLFRPFPRRERSACRTLNFGPRFGPPGRTAGSVCRGRGSGFPEPLEHSRKTRMGRRTVLLIVAALIAALGTGMVFLYVRGADNRAEAAQAPVQVLKAVTQIAPGETMAAAQAAGKIQVGTVPRAQVLAGAVNSAAGSRPRSRCRPSTPTSRSSPPSSATSGEQSALTIPDGDIAISVKLSDTGRVAGFVTPGATSRSSSPARTPRTSGATRLLLPSVKVIAVGTTTVVSTTTTDPAGAADHRGASQDALHLAARRTTPRRSCTQPGTVRSRSPCSNDKSKVKRRSRRHHQEPLQVIRDAHRR